ncbi:MAG: hypothetical protein MZV70_62725 [Desulfobacterales bacterium]|nr:hypothetical protein [Desulfobacterales bacterium]
MGLFRGRPGRRGSRERTQGSAGLGVEMPKILLSAICGALLPLAMSQAQACPTAQLVKVKESSMESSKRRAPSAKPVTHKGVRYEQVKAARSRGFGQNGGIIAAVDVVSGKELWTLQLYQTVYDPNEELDAQDVYLEELKIDATAGVLIARDERGRTFRVSLKDRALTEPR